MNNGIYVEKCYKSFRGTSGYNKNEKSYEMRWRCSKHLVIKRKNFWNGICQSKDPSFKMWKRHGD